MPFSSALFWGHPAPQAWIIGSLILAVLFTAVLATLLTRNFEPEHDPKHPNSEDLS